MLFNIRVLEFWVMETTNIYDFLHLLSLIKIIPNMNFERHLHIYAVIHFFLLFFSLESGERLINEYQTKR